MLLPPLALAACPLHASRLAVFASQPTLMVGSLPVAVDTRAELHAHTTLSTGDGFRMPDEHVESAVACGITASAATEHGNVSSHVKHEIACKAAGIKPIFGVELYCDTGDERGQLKHHLTTLAMNQTGYSNLLGLVTDTWNNFRYKPTATGAMLSQYSDGLIVLSGCLGSRLASAMLGGKGTDEKTVADLRAGERVAAQFREVFGDRYYLEVMAHPTLSRQVAYNQAIARVSRKLGIPMVATGDVHYPTIADQDMYPVLHAIERGGNKNTLEAQSQSWEYDIELCHHDAATMQHMLRNTGLSMQDSWGAIEQSLAIADRCTALVPKLKDLVYPSKLGSEQTLREWVRKGWTRRGMGRLHGAERRRYLDRLRYELDLVVAKGFTDYFLVISEAVRWAKRQGIIVGPARGSAAASLVCYLLAITEVNPMMFNNLLFERFIDPNRHDLPDIDLDFDDDRRHEVREHMVDKYGADRVGNIGTFVMYKGKNSVEAIGRIHQIPPFEIDIIKDSLIERRTGDLRGNNTIEDSIDLFPNVKAIFDKHPVLKNAMRLEGNVAAFSKHAAGLVVAQEPLAKSVAVYQRKDTKTGQMMAVTSIDKYDAEHVGALKIDFLGLTTMGMVSRCLQMIGMSIDELYAVPLDDEKVYDAYRANKVVGIFQFDGRAMRSVNREVKPDNFAELCDINAISRPGPLHSGAASEYILVKHGKKKAEHFHKIVSDITAHTNSQIVYQEQILQVVRLLAGFTWEEAAHIRKLISKKHGEQAFNRMRDKFMDGCAARGDITDQRAALVWKQLVTAGAYAFNAAHCVSYGMLAYWCMWLKVNHPLEFYCAALQKYDPKTKGLDLLREAASLGIAILPPDPRRSGHTWAPVRYKDGTRALLAGLTQVKGIGDSLAPQMIAYRDEHLRKGEPWDWSSWLDMRGYGNAKVAMLNEFCAKRDPFDVYRLQRKCRAARRWLAQYGEENMLPVPTSKSEDIPYEPIRGEHVWIGMVALHRGRNYKDIFESHRSRTGEELDPTTVREPQYEKYCVISGEDETGPLTITVHRWGGLYEKYQQAIFDIVPGKDLVLVRGFKRAEHRRAIYATELHVIATDDEE